MKRTRITPNAEAFPQALRSLVRENPVFDSSCSSEARVFYIENGSGLFLKRAPKGDLEREALLTRYFHSKGLAANVVSYLSEECDWLLTERVKGEDCTHEEYLKNPTRLCDLYAQILRNLHETNAQDCPVPKRMDAYFALAEKNYLAGQSDLSFFCPACEKVTVEDAWCLVEKNRDFFQNDTLLHGDFCLPNIMLDNWRFSGFIDLGNAGVGDRHVDLFWGAWTLAFNLGTDAYRNRFFDAYGRDRIELEKIEIISAAEVFG